MIPWELRAKILLYIAKLLGVKLRDLYDSYPFYNPYSKSEVQQFLKDATRHEVDRRN